MCFKHLDSIPKQTHVTYNFLDFDILDNNQL